MEVRLPVKEVPIQFTDRQFGESKMNTGIVKEGVLGVLKLRWYSFFTSYRRRVKKNCNRNRFEERVVSSE